MSLRVVTAGLHVIFIGSFMSPINKTGDINMVIQVMRDILSAKLTVKFYNKHTMPGPGEPRTAVLTIALLKPFFLSNYQGCCPFQCHAGIELVYILQFHASKAIDCFNKNYTFLKALETYG